MATVYPFHRVRSVADGVSLLSWIYTLHVASVVNVNSFKTLKRKCLYLLDKLNLLDNVHKGMKKKDVAAKYSIAVSQQFLKIVVLSQNMQSVRMWIRKDLSNVHVTTLIMLF